jgi:predicted Zn-dependent protease
VIDLDALIAVLRKRKRSDWSVVSRTVRRATVQTGRGLVRFDDETRIALVVHVDIGRGRGTGEIDVTGDAGDDPTAIVEAAETRALALVGPSWETPAPAAPAKVDLVDPQLEPADASAATAVLDRLPSTADGEVTVEHATVRLTTGGVSGRDLAVSWAETRIGVRAVLESSGRTVELAADARRIEDLRLAERIRLALVDADQAGAAIAPPPGTYAVALHATAHAHGGYGLWGALVVQADAALVRQGLSRYRPGEPIAPRANLVDEPLDVISDGTLRFGLLSAPCGDRGEPVRRFLVVERGIARGTAYDQREAALARREPNGGIRNLVIPGGSTPAADLLRPLSTPDAPSLVEVRRFAWLDLDPRTGFAVASIAAGQLHTATGPRPLSSGTLRFDSVAALAAARRSKELLLEGPISGPAILRLDAITVG